MGTWGTATVGAPPLRLPLRWSASPRRPWAASSPSGRTARGMALGCARHGRCCASSWAPVSLDSAQPTSWCPWNRAGRRRRGPWRRPSATRGCRWAWRWRRRRPTPASFGKEAPRTSPRASASRSGRACCWCRRRSGRSRRRRRARCSSRWRRRARRSAGRCWCCSGRGAAGWSVAHSPWRSTPSSNVPSSSTGRCVVCVSLFI